MGKVGAFLVGEIKMKDHSIHGYAARLTERHEAVIREACVVLRTRYNITEDDPDMLALTDACRELVSIVNGAADARITNY